MNKNAGREGFLIMTVRMPGGEALPMVVDTGSDGTCFNTNVESTLGKRLGTGAVWQFGTKHKIGVYAAPKLYLGGTPLKMTGTNVAVGDFRTLSSDAGRPVMGILGMDVLGHYCIQLDFKRGKMRFLDDDRANQKDWGTLFLLTDIGDGCFAINENLVGAKGPGSLIDTGCDYDGWLTPRMFEQWTNHEVLPAKGQARSPNGVLGGQIYRELDLEGLEPGLDTNDSHMKFNGIGLHLLSEDLVTLDFPRKTMYLKRTSKWPLYEKSLVSEGKWEIKPAVKFLTRLKKEGRLPGWSKKDQSSNEDQRAHFQYHHHLLDAVIFDIRKKGDSSIYHYTLTRTNKARAPAFRCPRQVGNHHDTFACASKAGSWKLKKAWRTDQNGRTIDVYSVPQK